MSEAAKMTDSDKSSAGCLLAILLMPLSWLIVAIAARDAWNEMVGPFFRLPALTLAQTFSLRIGISVFRRVVVPPKLKRDERDPWFAVRMLFAATLAWVWVQVALWLWGVR